MSDRYAWIHQPLTQDLISKLEGAKKGLLEYVAEGGTIKNSVDETAMSISNIHGRIKVIEETLEIIQHEVEEVKEEVTEDTTKEYKDA
jgi:hypothetical protein|tara:strand:- start:152 stop:415 length:264 start_codon:yes stop_codon:yes gene_type:complete